MTPIIKALLLLSVLSFAGPAGPSGSSQIVRFRTGDGWTICGSYQAPRKARPVAVLVHGVAAGKGEWAALQTQLARRGIGSLAIDLRGHGQSTAGPSGQTDFQLFDAGGEWPHAQKDVEAAAAFLKNRGIPASRLGYIGASIGANLASWAKPKPRWLVLLSPGIDYRGTHLAPPPAGLPVLVAAAAGDPYAWRTTQAYAAAKKDAVFLRARQGHGAQMLSDPELLKNLLAWIERNSR